MLSRYFLVSVIFAGFLINIAIAAPRTLQPNTNGSSYVTGAAQGYAAGVTGGGNAQGAVPSSLKELTSWLADNEPRTILIDRTFDYRNSEGVCQDCPGCAPPAVKKCGNKAQLAIAVSTGWCDPWPKAKVTYDKAGTSGLKVGSNKSIIGISKDAAIIGKGLNIDGGADNIIVQGILLGHINDALVWGGDIFNCQQGGKVWVDHVTFYRTGGKGCTMTISNCLFDGEAQYSEACNGHHYWGIFFNAGTPADNVMLSANTFTMFSGRLPKLNGNAGTFSSYLFSGNLFSDVEGHAVEIMTEVNNVEAIFEGNIFEKVETIIDVSKGDKYDGVWIPTTSQEALLCQNALGRPCQLNKLIDSKKPPIPKNGPSHFKKPPGSGAVISDYGNNNILANSGRDALFGGNGGAFSHRQNSQGNYGNH